MKDWYTKEELYPIFMGRLSARHIIYDDIYLDTDLICDIIRDDSQVCAYYCEWLEDLCDRSMFKTQDGDVPFSNIERLWIELFNVYIQCGNKKYRVLSPRAEEKILWVNSIKDIELQITDDVVSQIKKKKNELIALPDLSNVINEVCGDKPRKTTYESTKAIKDAILGNDETEELLHRMGYELILDMQKIFEEVPIYWGKR